MTTKPRLTLLEGGRHKKVSLRSISLQILPDSDTHPPVDIRVFEEDTFLVLTVDKVIRHTEEHPIRLMTGVAEAKPNKPGSVIMNNNSWYAIIHDLDREPSWNEKWIQKAYQQTLLLSEIKRIRSIGIPLLGSVYGSLPPEQSLEMFITSLLAVSIESLQKICILVPWQSCDKTWQQLQRISRHSTAE